VVVWIAATRVPPAMDGADNESSPKTPQPTVQQAREKLAACALTSSYFACSLGPLLALPVSWKLNTTSPQAYFLIGCGYLAVTNKSGTCVCTVREARAPCWSEGCDGPVGPLTGW
jgi:hypothetical protein